MQMDAFAATGSFLPPQKIEQLNFPPQNWEGEGGGGGGVRRRRRPCGQIALFRGLLSLSTQASAVVWERALKKGRIFHLFGILVILYFLRVYTACTVYS